MVGIASRYFAGRIALAAAAAAVVAVLTGMDGTGHVAMYATIVLGVAGGSFALLFSLALTVGDGDSLDREHMADHRPTPAYWPIRAALGMGVLMVGLVTDSLLTICGVALLLISAIEWTMSAWAEHLSTDAESNAIERARLLRPFEIALYGALAIAIPVVLASRIFLTVSKNAASWSAIVISAVILAFAFVLYARPLIRRAVVASMLVLGGIALIVVGITSAVIGEREFHVHGHAEVSTDHSGESDGGTAGSDEMSESEGDHG